MSAELVAAQFEGIYGVPEAARYLHATIRPLDPKYLVPSRKLIRWIRAGLSSPKLVDVPGSELLISFEDLVSLRVITFLRSRGIPFSEIREAERYLRDKTGYHRPFATERLWVESKGAVRIYAELSNFLVVANRGGQLAFVQMVKDGLVDIHGMTFDQRGVADSWAPRGCILMHPRIQFGSPCIAGTRIPTSAIAGMVKAGDSIDFLAESYSVSKVQIQAALDWEEEIAAA